jgi:transcriptional regulator with XRE-family HTH domain
VREPSAPPPPAAPAPPQPPAPTRTARIPQHPGAGLSVPRLELGTQIARNLVLARHALHFTQDALARSSRIARATIAQIEAGSTDFRLSTFVEISRALKISPTILFLRASDITSAPQFLRQVAVERILAQLDAQQIEHMNRWRQSGLHKDLLRTADAGIHAAAAAGFRTPCSVVGAGIGSTVLPGLGTAVGALLGAALDEGHGIKTLVIEDGAGI